MHEIFTYSLEKPELKQGQVWYQILISKGSFGEDRFNILNSIGLYLPLKNLDMFDLKQILSLSKTAREESIIGMATVYAITKEL